MLEQKLEIRTKGGTWPGQNLAYIYTRHILQAEKKPMIGRVYFVLEGVCGYLEVALSKGVAVIFVS